MTRPERAGVRALLLAIPLLFACSLGCGVGPATEPRANVEPAHVRILSIHDFHGALRPALFAWSDGRTYGGAAALKWVMDSLETACACPTFRLDAGDQMQGTLASNLTYGASVVAAFNHLSLDAAAAGNHELDWGIDTFRVRRGEADYAWLAANVYQRSEGVHPDWAEPFTVLERGGVRVGVVGYATRDTPRTLRRATTAPYEFRTGYEAIRVAIQNVWRTVPDFVIVVAHAGGDCRGGTCSGEMVELAEELPPGVVHLILGGHDHRPGEGLVNGIPILRSGSHGRAVGVVDLYRGADGTHRFETSIVAVQSTVQQEDTVMNALIAPHLAAADAVGNRRITSLAELLAASPTGDRRLGHLIADAIRRAAKADVGLHNPGGVRADLPAGDITYADLHRTMPFGNNVVRIGITGRQLRALYEQIGDRYYFTHAPLAGDGASDPGVLALGDLHSLSFSDHEVIHLATSDFLADGGDGLALFASLPREEIEISVLDAVVALLGVLEEPVIISVGAPPVENHR